MIAHYINSLHSPWNVLVWIALVLGVMGMCILITKLNNAIFKRIQRKNPGLHVVFLQHMITIVIIIGFIVLVISSFAGVQTIWTTLFGGTAIISAVLAFAAQDVIKDVLAGMMISAHRPFKVGDRIVLEDGTTGVVEDVTLRHVVLKSTESLRFVVPNHVINGMRLTNYSYKTITRSATFKFSVGYDSNMKLVKRVIARAIESSEYTVEGYIDRNGYNHYGEVYFVAFADSALILQVNVYYLPTTPTERVMDDINTRVREALIANHIEIPYNYVNIVTKTEEPEEPKPFKKPLVRIEERPAALEEKRAYVEKPVEKAEPKPAQKTEAKSTVKEEIKPDVKPPVKTEFKPAAKVEPKPVAKIEVKPVPKQEAKPAIKAEEKQVEKVEAKPAVKAEVKPAVKTEVKPVAKTDVKPTVKTDVKPAAKAEVKPAAKVETKAAVKAEAKSDVKPVAKPATAVKEPVKVADKPVAKPEAKTEAKPAVKAESKPVAKPEAKSAVKTDVKPAAKAEPKPAAKAEAKPAAKPAEKTPTKEPAKAAAKPAEKAPAKPANKVEATKPAAKPETKPAAKASEKKGK